LDECYERHAVANGVYVAAANRIGLEQYNPDTGIQFWDLRLLWDHKGEILASLTTKKKSYCRS
jgi:N-carbamoylputrescine amidase